MAQYVRDLSDFIQVNTIVYRNVPDINGEKLNSDGSEREWKITPPTPDGEEKIERIKRSNTDLMGKELQFLKARWDRIQGNDPEPGAPTADEDMDPLLLGEQYAPLLAAYVTNVELDPDDLKRDFHGKLLEMLVEEIQGFFADMKSRRDPLKKK